jgi:cation diffusion facilitator family transporter
MSSHIQKAAIRTSYFSIITNISLSIAKWLAGFFGNSYALIADAIESTTDIFSSFLVMMGLKYAQRPADENHPYGHGRIEPLVTFFVVGFLIVSATIIGYQSIININRPHELPAPWTLVVLGVIIVWKEISYRWVLQKSKETNSSSLKADAWHHRSDAITSVAAFLGIAIALILGPGFEAADDYAALFASGFILYNSYKIFRPALGEIMDEHIHPELVAKIRAIALTVDGIKGTEKCYVRKLGTQYNVDLHAIVDGYLTVAVGHDIAHRLKDAIMNQLPEVSNVLVHIEPECIH